MQRVSSKRWDKAMPRISSEAASTIFRELTSILSSRMYESSGSMISLTCLITNFELKSRDLDEPGALFVFKLHVDSQSDSSPHLVTMKSSRLPLDLRTGAGE